MTSLDILNSTSYQVRGDMTEESFDDFWQSVIEYADEVGVSTEYIEDEFILEGELVKVNIKHNKQTK